MNWLNIVIILSTLRHETNASPSESATTDSQTTLAHPTTSVHSRRKSYLNTQLIARLPCTLRLKLDQPPPSRFPSLIWATAPSASLSQFSQPHSKNKARDHQPSMDVTPKNLDICQFGDLSETSQSRSAPKLKSSRANKDIHLPWRMDQTLARKIGSNASLEDDKAIERW